MEKIKVNKGFNKKYGIDYKYVCEGFRPYCEFEYNGKKYGFSVHGRLGYTLEANIDNELTKIIEYSILNDKEKQKEIRFDKIVDKDYYLLVISNKEECYFSDVKVGNKNVEIEAYEHDGMFSTYYIVNFHNRKTHNSCGFSYNPYFRTLDFDSVPEDASVYIKNVGDECMFLQLNLGRLFIKPGEQVKYCEKNYIKEDSRILFCYGKEIEKFEIPNA